jgi:hypothetical protein
MNTSSFRDTAPYISKVNGRFGEICRLDFQGRRVNQEKDKQAAGSCTPAFSGLNGVIFLKMELFNSTPLHIETQ